MNAEAIFRRVCRYARSAKQNRKQGFTEKASLDEARVDAQIRAAQRIGLGILAENVERNARSGWTLADSIKAPLEALQK